MVKRYYRSCITVKYALVKFLLAIAVFILAYFAFRTKNDLFFYTGSAFGIALIIVMIVEWFNKQKVTKCLKEIRQIEDYYQEGALLGKTFVLDGRMLVADEKLHIEEITTEHVTHLTVVEMNKGKKKATLIQSGNTYTFMLDNRTQAGRLAAFLARKNPGIVIEGCEQEGDGTLNALKKD